MRVDRLKARASVAFALIGILGALGGVLYSSVRANQAIDRNRQIIARLNAEGAQRRDETCRQLEGKHLDSLHRLEGTYRYLVALSPVERGSTLNRFIIHALPDQEREARADTAPAFCYEKGVGLPGPVPKIPKRPVAVDRLIKE